MSRKLCHFGVQWCQWPLEWCAQHPIAFSCLTDTGQTYYTLLVYLTQKIAITHASQKYCALTETHDQVSAWGGIGSAISTLCKQATLPSSFHQIFLISLYLSTISILNVTTPALVSVASFNYVVSTRVETQGIPESFALPDK
jgi:hypothetical protein